MYYLCLVKRSRPDEPVLERLSKLDYVLYAAAVTGDVDGIIISSKLIGRSCYPIRNLKVKGRGYNQALYVIFKDDTIDVYIIRYRRNTYLSKLEDKIYERKKPKKDRTYVVLRVFKDLITRRDRNTSSKAQQLCYLSP